MLFNDETLLSAEITDKTNKYQLDVFNYHSSEANETIADENKVIALHIMPDGMNTSPHLGYLSHSYSGLFVNSQTFELG